MRRAARKDKLHLAVGNIWGQCGWSMLDLSSLGDGRPDWLAARAAFSVLIEVKTPGWERPGSGTQAAQAKFRSEWKGCPVIVVETVEAAWLEAEAWRGKAMTG